MPRPDAPQSPRGVLLGGFELLERIGTGGAGHVWRAVDTSDGTPAAVKVLARLDPEHTAAFRHEVRAVAALDHPNVVQVLDAGETAGAAALTLGAPEGTPWLAMELAEEGSLSDRRGELAWTELKRVLLELLDALAHAHARGVVHRDLKPGNVLRGGLRPGIKLSDFGIAQLVGPTRAASATPLGGTPNYMAPEQFAGTWRDLGPWTDLYALGATGWALATGAPPFRGRTLPECARAHLERPPPAFVPRHEVPAGLEGWLRRLLAKDPRDRFRRAAEAARALEEADGGPPVARGLPPRWERGPGWPARRTTLALFGLRPVPVVGRRAERDAIWAALREAVDGQPRAVLLTGSAGTGKSRLAEWACERAHELGAVEVLVALHGREPGPGHGHLPMLARALGCGGADRAAVEARLGSVLPRLGLGGEDERAATAELLSPTPGAGRIRLSDAERAALALRLLEALARERPLLLWADDLQWGADTAELALRLIEGSAPVIVVASVNEDALGDDPAATERLRQLAAHPGCRTVRVDPLGRRATRELLRAGLGLSEALARAVEPRVEGRPLFALQLVADWVARGEVRPTPEGLALVEGVEPSVPDDVSGVWRARLDRACAGSAAALRAVALAACLGLEVDPAEWARAAAAAGVTVPAGLAGRLLDERLWRPALSGAGFVFVHGDLRRVALEAVGDPAPLHRACAAALADSGAEARLGRHRLLGGEAEAAVGPLLDAATRAASDGELREADELADLAWRALEAAGAPPADPRRGACLARQAEVARTRGDFARARGFALRLLEGPTVPAWAAARLRARATLAVLALKAREVDAAAAELTEVVAGLERLGEGALATRYRVMLAVAHQYRGDLRGAITVIAHATARSRELDDSAASGEAHRIRGAIALQLGLLAEAAEHHEAARAIFAAGGHRTGRALAEAGLGDTARFAGRLDEAEHWYLRAVDGLEACGAASVVGVRASLALVRMERGEWAEARKGLEAGARQLERAGAVLEARRLLRVLAVPCHAALGDWAAFDEALAAGDPVVDADVVRALDRAAALATERGETARAKRARAVADRVRRALGRPAH